MARKHNEYHAHEKMIMNGLSGQIGEEYGPVYLELFEPARES